MSLTKEGYRPRLIDERIARYLRIFGAVSIFAHINRISLFLSPFHLLLPVAGLSPARIVPCPAHKS